MFVIDLAVVEIRTSGTPNLTTTGCGNRAIGKAVTSLIRNQSTTRIELSQGNKTKFKLIKPPAAKTGCALTCTITRNCVSTNSWMLVNVDEANLFNQPIFSFDG